MKTNNQAKLKEKVAVSTVGGTGKVLLICGTWCEVSSAAKMMLQDFDEVRLRKIKEVKNHE